jgi:hypothetical protein
MGFDGSARHIELAGDFGIVTALQKQFDDLPLTRSQPNGLLVHYSPSGLDLPRLYNFVGSWDVSKLGSIHDAILRRKRSRTEEQPFPQALADSSAGFQNTDSGSQSPLRRSIPAVGDRPRARKGCIKSG